MFGLVFIAVSLEDEPHVEWKLLGLLAQSVRGEGNRAGGRIDLYVELGITTDT